MVAAALVIQFQAASYDNYCASAAASAAAAAARMCLHRARAFRELIGKTTNRRGRGASRPSACQSASLISTRKNFRAFTCSRGRPLRDGGESDAGTWPQAPPDRPFACAPLVALCRAALLPSIVREEQLPPTLPPL